ncbi:hypothetical protein NDU88_004193 [Pleurodeles waltl]|uniref:Uncharacterized protein n=1 Tax=Pleurodeles waltl TaxID=8319 RepID=A0AAV7LHJ8_PLEWA|nr:hypothetical protein NDU88_004193 [Pleurodeles waltl]
MPSEKRCDDRAADSRARKDGQTGMSTHIVISATIPIASTSTNQLTGFFHFISNQKAQFEKEVADLQEQHVATEERYLLTSIKTKINGYHDVMQRGGNHLGKYAVAPVYGEGERLGTSLAASLQPCRDSNVVLEVLDEQGQSVHTTEAEADCFHRYCTALYTAHQTVDDSTDDHLADKAL